jgi:hypothetical protein
MVLSRVIFGSDGVTRSGPLQLSTIGHQQTARFGKELIVCVLSFESLEAAITGIGEFVRYPRRGVFFG